MQRLSGELLEQNLFGADDCEVTGEFVTDAPRGFEKSFFEKFLRLLKTDKLSDCDDISNDELIEMLVRGKELFGSLHVGTMFEDSMFRSLEHLKSQPIGRRVL